MLSRGQRKEPFFATALGTEKRTILCHSSVNLKSYTISHILLFSRGYWGKLPRNWVRTVYGPAEIRSGTLLNTSQKGKFRLKSNQCSKVNMSPVQATWSLAVVNCQYPTFAKPLTINASTRVSGATLLDGTRLDWMWRERMGTHIASVLEIFPFCVCNKSQMGMNWIGQNLTGLYWCEMGLTVVGIR